MFDGKKTFIGLVMIVLGWFGKDVISQDELEMLIFSVTQIAGLVLAIYGRFHATKIYVHDGRGPKGNPRSTPTS